MSRPYTRIGAMKQPPKKKLVRPAVKMSAIVKGSAFKPMKIMGR